MKTPIIEGDLASLELTSEVLQAGGHVAMPATSVDPAIRAIKAVKRLPGTEAFAVAGQCREGPGTRDIPIFAITSYLEEYGKEAALKAGCDSYTVTPSNTRTLLQQIENVVGAKAKTSCSNSTQ